MLQSCNRKMTKIKSKMGIIGVLLILFISIGLSPISAVNNDSGVITVSNINVYPDEDFYIVDCDITPNKDLDYLVMLAKWYDKNGMVIANSVYLWTMSYVTKGEVIKASGSESFYMNEKPSKMKLFIFDHAFKGDYSNAIFTKELDLK